MEKIDYKDTYKNLIKRTPIKWKKFGFAMLPHSLMLDGKISKSGLLIFWALTIHLFQGKNYCFPSLRTLQKETGLSRPSVVKGIKDLENNKNLVVEKTKGKVNKYYLEVKI